MYRRSGKVEWVSSSKLTGLPPLFGNPINMGCPFLSPAPGVYSWSIRNTWLIWLACFSRLSYPRLIIRAAFILESVMLLSVSITDIRRSSSAFCISTPIPVEGEILIIAKYLAPTILPVSTLQISSL